MVERLVVDTFHSGRDDHPDEDAYGQHVDGNQGIFTVFDGVTLSHYRPYPDPSPAAIAAQRAVDAVLAGYAERAPRPDMAQLLVMANAAIRAYNTSIGTTSETVDFLKRQYAAAVGAVAVIADGRLYAAQINDTELSVLDTTGERIYRLSSDKRAFYAHLQHLRTTGVLAEKTAEEHHYIRRNLVNHDDIMFQGKTARSGVLTGEPIAERFITTGEYGLAPGMTLAVYSDGFLPLLERAQFRQLVATGTSGQIKTAVHQLEETEPSCQSEKSMVRVRMLQS